MPSCTSPKRDAGLQIAKSRVFHVSNLGNFVAQLQIGSPCGAADHRSAHNAGHFRNPDGKCDRRHDESEDDIHNHAGGDDRHPLGHALRHVAARIVWHVRIGNWFRRQIAMRHGRRMLGGGQRCLAVRRTRRGGRCYGFVRRSCPLALLRHARGVVVLAEHLHVSAQWENADAVFCFPPAKLAKLQAVDVEAQVEFFALYAARFGHEKMAQLVHEDHKAQAGRHGQDSGPIRRVSQPRSPSSGDQVHTQRVTS